MSIGTFIGLIFIVAGAGLEEFAVYRKTVARTQRKCNDSKATLLLYYSTGVCCEITGLFIVSFYSYLLAATFHIIFLIYFAHRAPPTKLSKLSFVLFALGFAISIFIHSPSHKTIESLNIPFLFMSVILSIAGCFASRFASNSLAKIALCSGAGSVINICLKEVAEMSLATLEGTYFGMLEILVILGVLVVSSLLQCTVTSVLLEKFEQHKVYAGYYLVNLLCSFIAAQVLFEEELVEFSLVYISIGAVVAAALALANDSFVNKFKTLEEV